MKKLECGRKRVFIGLFGALLLTFALMPQPASAGPSASRSETGVFAGGCFWGMEAVFQSLKGVRTVVSGYSGGNQLSAQYELVSTGATGHAESVQVQYDPARISYRTLLDVFFLIAHDPTERNRQGPDEGSQYRSVVFYADDAQRRVALATVARLTKEKRYAAPIVTEIVPLRGFYPAEAYHQHFAERNPADPYIVENDAPKVAALRRRFPELVKPV